MPSQSLQSLSDALAEIPELSSVGTAVRGLDRTKALRRVRAIGRGQIVLLSSHFERYVYAINEEAVAVLNASGVQSAMLPEALRLLHSARAVDEMSLMQWPNRGPALEKFMRTDGWLWRPPSAGQIEHDRLLTWMKAPHAAEIVRYYRYWKIEDIFTSVTRTKPNRTFLYLSIQELVDKRNEIAHGDYNAQATSTDIARYVMAVRKFCTRADRVLARALARIRGGVRPW